MRVFSFFVLFFAYHFGISQIPHEHPDHPKGNNSNDQYLALPYYNEACELYKQGDIEKAKIALREAIDMSFALTEAQLFLGTIMYEQNKLDSACLYLNSGIDFAPETKAHYYMMFFETAFKLEQYDYAKHWLKSFKNLFGKYSEGQFEEDYSYTVDDLERIEASLEMVFNYHYWIPKAFVIDTISFEKNIAVAAFNNDVITCKETGSLLLKSKKNFKKHKQLAYDLTDVLSISISKNQEILFVSKLDGADVNIYFARKKGKSWGALNLVSGEVNSSAWDSDPFYDETRSLIYFSSDRGGNKDIYVAKFDPETGMSASVTNIERINTRYDEIKPKFIDDKFYFSSNGHPGFGGFDLYWTEQYWIENGIVQPSDWFNMGKPYNSGKDETEIHFLSNKQQVLHQKNWNGNEWLILLKCLAKEETIDMELKISTKVHQADLE